MFATELKRTLGDVCGRQTGGLQNRLKGAVEVSLVGSIPIHPRQIRCDSQAAHWGMAQPGDLTSGGLGRRVRRHDSVHNRGCRRVDIVTNARCRHSGPAV
jgi:hypothetical protein